MNDKKLKEIAIGLKKAEKLHLTKILLERYKHTWKGFVSILEGLNKYNNLSEKQLDVIWNFTDTRSFCLLNKSTSSGLAKCWEEFEKTKKDIKVAEFQGKTVGLPKPESKHFEQDKRYYIKDAQEMVKVPAKYGLPFKDFNVIQSSIYPYRNKNWNFIISASTSSGKTITSEILVNDALELGHSLAYVSPLKAISEEKYIDWSDITHRWNSKNISQVSGDFQLTHNRIEELNSADIILLTIESALSRCRNHRSEKSEWIKKITTLIVDESHLINSDSRGDKLEILLMTFTKINPRCRIIFLSASIPNVEVNRLWLTKLNNKKTFVLESNYRPVKLDIEYVKVNVGSRTYKEDMAGEVASILRTYRDDKFIVFGHSKKFLSMVHRDVVNSGLYKEHEAKIYNADVSHVDRVATIEEFNNPTGELKVILGTSSLALGVNLSARRVIIVDVFMGLQPIEHAMVGQSIGRAGRVGFYDKGDAHILLPNRRFGNTFDELVEWCESKFPITSKLTEENLPFHIMNEISNGNIRNYEDINTWIRRSFRAMFTEENNFEAIIKGLTDCKAIAIDDIGEYEVLNIGKVSSMFFIDPKTVYSYYLNLVSSHDGWVDEDIMCSKMLGDVTTIGVSFTNASQKTIIENDTDFQANLPMANVFEGNLKEVYVAWLALRKEYVQEFYSGSVGFKSNLGRIKQVFNSLNNMYAMNKQTMITDIFTRFEYGINSKQLELSRFKGIGKVALEKLNNSKVYSTSDLKVLSPEQIKYIFKTRKSYDRILKLNSIT